MSIKTRTHTQPCLEALMSFVKAIWRSNSHWSCLAEPMRFPAGQILLESGSSRYMCVYVCMYINIDQNSVRRTLHSAKEGTTLEIHREVTCMWDTGKERWGLQSSTSFFFQGILKLETLKAPSSVEAQIMTNISLRST